MMWAYAAFAIALAATLVSTCIGLRAWLTYRRMTEEERELDRLLWELECWDGRVPHGFAEEDDERD